MTAPVLGTHSQVKLAIQNFRLLAKTLGMSEAEQRDVLGLSRDELRAWNVAAVDLGVPIAPSLIRRLRYALPLMQRMVANMQSASAGRVADARPEHRALN